MKSDIVPINLIVLRGSGGMLSQENFFTFQPLRLFLVASDTWLGRNLSVISIGSPPFKSFIVKCWMGDVSHTACSRRIFGASLSEPHINGTAMREFYIIIIIIIIMVCRSREIISPAWLYEHKREIFYCAFSCLGYGPYISSSNLANCKFTLVLVLQYWWSSKLLYRCTQVRLQGGARQSLSSAQQRKDQLRTR